MLYSNPVPSAGVPTTMVPVATPHDGWTVTTRDRSLSAQFEHSIGVTATGCEIFTLSPKEQHFPPYKV